MDHKISRKAITGANFARDTAVWKHCALSSNLSLALFDSPNCTQHVESAESVCAAWLSTLQETAWAESPPLRKNCAANLILLGAKLGSSAIAVSKYDCALSTSPRASPTRPAQTREGLLVLRFKADASPWSRTLNWTEPYDTFGIIAFIAYKPEHWSNSPITKEPTNQPTTQPSNPAHPRSEQSLNSRYQVMHTIIHPPLPLGPSGGRNCTPRTRSDLSS